MQKTPVKRHVDGILLLDKSLGITSNTALQRVKRLFQAIKAGHTGSLDPLASGLLPICLGEATKFSQFLLDADKSYLVQGQLGILTSTGDAEGDVIATAPIDHLSIDSLEKTLIAFQGEVQQYPPMYSAVKIQGQPLYKLARQGKVVERIPRTITIKKIELKKIEWPFFEMQVYCSKGTYIRTLVEDIGKSLDCGASVTKLHRTQTGIFNIDDAHKFADLEEYAAKNNVASLNDFLLPIDAGLQHFPAIKLEAGPLTDLRHGKTITVKSDITGLCRVYSIDTEMFIGLIQIDDNAIAKVHRLTSERPKS